MRAVNTSVIYQHLSEELSGKVIYDDPSVFHRLRVFEEDETTIDLCHSQLQTEMGPPIGELVRIADTASRIRADMKHGMAQELHVGYRSPRLLFLLILLLMEEDSNCLRSMRRWARMHRLRLR